METINKKFLQAVKKSFNHEIPGPNNQYKRYITVDDYSLVIEISSELSVFKFIYRTDGSFSRSAITSNTTVDDIDEIEFVHSSLMLESPTFSKEEMIQVFKNTLKLLGNKLVESTENLASNTSYYILSSKKDFDLFFFRFLSYLEIPIPKELSYASKLVNFKKSMGNSFIAYNQEIIKKNLNL